MNEILPDHGRIAFYMRLSVADGDLICGEKNESNSIENQRSLLREFVARLIEKEMHDGYDKFALEMIAEACFRDISEYIDDGYSGTNFDRPAFGKMIEDAKCRKINTIIVKDTSRLGRDHIEVGDYMEQIFPLLGIRFIAINNGYDSLRCKNTATGLETSIMNLVNAEYSRDLSRKIRSSRRTMWADGISTGGQAPFGYRSENKKYIIDPETAPVVRCIFEKAMNGCNTRAIADHLNEKHIPTPGKFVQMRTGKAQAARVVSDDEWLWDTRMIYRILKNYSYTGSMVHGKTRTLTVGGRSVRRTDKNEQFIIENSHEAIVSADEWDMAQFAVRSVKSKSAKIPTGFVLLGKIRCGNCGLAMEYSAKRSAVVYCAHSICAGNASKCCRTRYDAERIGSVTAFELLRRMGMLESLGAKITEKYRNEPGISIRRKQTEHQLKMLASEKIRQYEAYADGMIRKDEFLRRKAELSDRMDKLAEDLQKYEYAAAEQGGLINEINAALAKFKDLLGNSVTPVLLTREMVLSLVEAVVIHDEHTIEVRTFFDNLCDRAAEYLENLETK